MKKIYNGRVVNFESHKMVLFKAARGLKFWLKVEQILALMRITLMWYLHKTPVLCTPFSNCHISITHNKKINTTTPDY